MSSTVRRPSLSVVVPVLNEGPALPRTLEAIRAGLKAGDELIVADGGSTDGSLGRAAAHAGRVIEAPRGRAVQMNAGAAEATGTVLWFVHADTGVPPQAPGVVREAVERGAVWGRFDVAIEGVSRWLPCVAAAMNARSRWTGIATGDQGIFVRRDVFRALGGYEAIPLMEDVRLSAALRRQVRPHCIRSPRLVTSGRRWDDHGALRTMARMWYLRTAHALGASPEWLAARYH